MILFKYKFKIYFQLISGMDFWNEIVSQEINLNKYLCIEEIEEDFDIQNDEIQM